MALAAWLRVVTPPTLPMSPRALRVVVIRLR